MACLSSRKICAKVQEKFMCQLLQNTQIKRKVFTYDSRTLLPACLMTRTFIQNQTSGTSSELHTGASHRERNQQIKSLPLNNNVGSKIINDSKNNSKERIQQVRHSSTAATNRLYAQHQQIRRNSSAAAENQCKQQHSQLRRSSSAANQQLMSSQQPGSALRDKPVDPYGLLEDDLKDVYYNIRQILTHSTTQPELDKIASYYFDGQGKALRPMVAVVMSRAVNYHIGKDELLNSQRDVAMIIEMIHTASLVHDDVIDQSDCRRGKPSVNVLWNHKKVAMAGDFILAVAAMMIAKLRNDDVTKILSQVITDLVQGEFMQLGSKETENERFAHYLTKTYRKTASLIANSTKAVAILAGADHETCELAYQYGRNVGLAFQLVDDLLDFVSSSEAMGKPVAADLKLGLATAPVLFACERFPELNPMIMRRFQEPGDFERAFELVHQSQGLEQTRFLARKHCIEALRVAGQIAESPYQKALGVVCDLVVNRMK